MWETELWLLHKLKFCEALTSPVIFNDEDDVLFNTNTTPVDM